MKYCCKKMGEQIAWECKDHPDLSDCPDALIVRSEKYGIFGLRIHDGGSSYVEIAFCPWCGSKLSLVG